AQRRSLTSSSNCPRPADDPLPAHATTERRPCHRRNQGMGDSHWAIHDGGRQERAGSRPARGSAEHRAAEVDGARTGEREAGVNYTRRARFFAALVPILAVLVASLQGCAATPAAKADGEPIPLTSP